MKLLKFNKNTVLTASSQVVIFHNNPATIYGGRELDTFTSLEGSNTFRYAMLTNKISLAICQLERGKALDNIGKKAIGRGVEMLTQILKGAALIEKKVIQGISPSQEGLSEYGYALSALEKIGKVSQEDGFVEFFLTLYQDMKTLRDGEELSRDKLSSIEQFFEALSDLLGNEIQKSRFTTQFDSPTLLMRRKRQFASA